MTLRVGMHSIEVTLDQLLYGGVAFVALLALYFAWNARHSLMLRCLMAASLPGEILRKAIHKHRAERARRELKVTRDREAALKAQVADAVVRLLLYRVRNGMMSLQRSYDVQDKIALGLQCPELRSKVSDPDIIKDRIKARRGNGVNAPVNLPDAEAPKNRRGELLKIINGGKQ